MHYTMLSSESELSSVNVRSLSDASSLSARSLLVELSVAVTSLSDEALFYSFSASESISIGSVEVSAASKYFSSSLMTCCTYLPNSAALKFANFSFAIFFSNVSLNSMFLTLTLSPVSSASKWLDERALGCGPNPRHSSELVR